MLRTESEARSEPSRVKPRMKRGRIAGAAGSVLVVILLLSFLSGVASALTYYPPYSGWTFADVSQAGIGCGWNDIFVYPAAYKSNGKVVMNTASTGVGCGAYAINSWAGFWGPTFTASSSRWYTIIYKWQLWWDASVSTFACTSPWPPFYLGTNWAEGWIKVFGNLYDVTNGGWKLNGDHAVTVWNSAGSCGFSWAGYADGAYYYVDFDVYLTAGTTYQFYTYLMTHALADAVGAVTAHSVNNVGSSGDVAYVRYMLWS